MQTGVNGSWIRLIASILFAVSCFLLPAKNALAVASLNLSTSFQSVDGTRTYMDASGTWDTANNLEVTNNNPNAAATEPDGGDTFRLRIDNTAAVGAANRAFDFAISITLPSGIRLPQASNFNVIVNETVLVGGTVCSNINNVDADQVGNVVTLTFNANDELSPRCRYDFDLGLTTSNSAPFANSCNPGDAACDIRFDISHNQVNGTPATQQTASIIHQTDVAEVTLADLSLTKTANTVSAVDGAPISYDVVITNNGNGGIFDTQLTDTEGPNISFNQLTVAAPYAPPQPGPGVSTYTFDYIGPGDSTTVVVSADADIPADSVTCNLLNTASAVDLRQGLTATDFDSVTYDLNNQLTVTHDLTSSYCLLCGQGEVVLRVRNTGGITLTDINVSVNLSAAFPLESGLTYAPVPTPASVSVITGPATAFAMSAPALSGPNNSIVTFNLNMMGSPSDGTPSEPSEVEIRFNVERATGFGFDLEGLANPILTDLSIETTATFDSVCGASPAPISTGIQPLSLRQPIPVVDKLGWNVDAGQNISTAAPVVFGHEDDDIIWQVEVQNGGLAALEDLLVNDTIGGNFTFTAVCDNEPDATITANSGVVSGTCQARSGLTAAPFSPAANPDVPVTPASGFVYYVGRILSACSNATNTTDIEWGCEANVPAVSGGLNSAITTVGTDADTAILNTDVGGADLAPGLSNQLNVNVQFTGTHPTNFGATAQPAGSRGRVTITLTNDTGGTVRDIDFLNVLPAGQYVVDHSIPAIATTATNNPEFDITITPANGVASYPGMIDRVTWMNPVAIGDPIVDPLGNTSPLFRFDSTTSGPGGDEYRSNMLRHGDVLTLSFDVVLVDASRYDLVADLDIPQEINPVSDPDTGSPTGFAINNQLTVTFENACDTPNRRSLPAINNVFNAFPEDIDLEIIDPVSGLPSLEFILNTNSAIQLPLRVQLINNGGHDALNYFAAVTFGNAMKVDNAPANCTDVSSPQTLPRPYWDDPVPIPPQVDLPIVYQCDFSGFGIIGPGGGTLNLDFLVSRNDVSTVDDLTFRVDVVGEIQLDDGTPVIFPAVTTTPAAQIDNVANNYTLDGLRAKVIGFGLTKDLEGDCTEDASFAARDADAVFIGEDCKFKIRSGGWFGFDTPGFGIIAVHNITVSDQLPDGQGFISQTDGGLATVGGGSDPEILNIIFGSNAPPVPGPVAQLTEGIVSWNFNPVINKLTDKDKFFRTDITTRILNDPVDNSAVPNLHAQFSPNILDTTFDADFAGGVFSFGPITPGYPSENLRRIDMRITEPNIVITKTVCNETLEIDGTCDLGDFSQTVNNGDTEDFYVFKIRIENVDDSGTTGVSRAPAYNLVVVDTFDSSDLMQVYPIESPQTLNPLTYPFNNDGLDNDGDGVTDPADSNEAEILTDNIVNDSGNINPAVIKFSYTESNALLELEPGEFVELVYKVDPDDFIAPLQTLSNAVDVKYDSLEGLAGSQNVTQVPIDPDTYPVVNTVGSIGSARVYTDLATNNPGQISDVQVLPLVVEPKILVQTSLNMGAGPLPDLTNVRVGEEVEYKLRTLIPVANLREFTVRDELPPGIRCIDVPDVNLNAGVYAAAGFNPGGVFSVANGKITCNGNLVEWRFGDQELTASLGNMRFPFEVTFIARVENTPTTNVTPFNPGVNNCVIRNGGSGNGQSWSVPLTVHPVPLNAPVPPSQNCSQNTFVRTSYINDPTQGSQLIEHFFNPIQIRVIEPQIQVTKTFILAGSGNPGTDETVGDSKDIFDVRIDVVNNGDAPAYNLQMLDNLIATKYTYLGNIGGTDPPSSDGGITLPLAPVPTGAPGTNQPVFSWPVNFTVQTGAGNAISYIYRVQANDDFEPLENVDNSIEAKWTSLEDSAVALNSGGIIGTDGDVDGMRIGYFPGIEAVPVNVENDYLASNTDSITVPPLTFTKIDLDLQADITDTTRSIGEIRQYQLEISLPEGITTNIRVTDDLAFGDVDPPAGVQTYLLENAAPYEVQYQFFDVLEVNGTFPTQANAETIFNAAPANETSGSILWDIGTVVTDTEDDSPLNAVPGKNPRIVITYYARVNNDLTTNNNDDLRNEATLQYTSGANPPAIETVTVNTAAVQVTEPVLNVTKVADITTGDAGDIIQYTVTISHDAASTTDAYDLNIVDTIPASIIYDATTSLQVNGSNAGVSIPFISGAQLIWGRGNSNDDALDIPLGESLVLIYTVKIQDTVQPLEAITNSVVIDWTSINSASDGTTPDENARERFGIGGTDCSLSVAPNDYCAVPAVLPTITIVDNNAVLKSKTNDSFNLGPAGTSIRIGDIIEYTLTLTLQEGATRNLSVVDTLPNGLEFIDVVSINGDTGTGVSPNITYSDATIPFKYVGDNVIQESDVVVASGGGVNAITINIGDVITDGDNVLPNNDFVIVYRAVVTKDEFILPQVATTAINNTAVISYIDALGNPPSSAPLSRLSSTVNLSAQQPVIFLADLTKTHAGAIPSGDPVVPGEQMDFVLSACNTGTAPAYNLVLQDILPQYDAVESSPLLDFTTLTVPVVRINGVIVNTPADYGYTAPVVALPTTPSGTMVIAFTDAAPLPAAECATVNFSINVDTGVGAQLDWDNALQHTGYFSLPTIDANADVTERQIYLPQGPVFYNMNTIVPINQPEKALLSPITVLDEATIGEEITYQIKVPGDGAAPMQVNMFNVEIFDPLDNNLEFVRAELDGTSEYTGVEGVDWVANYNTGTNELTISVNQIDFNATLPTPGTEQAVFNVIVRLRNDNVTSSIVAPLTPAFSNSTRFSFTGPGGGGLIVTGFGVVPGADDVSVVEPQLTLTSKTVSNLTQADANTNAGDVLLYTLTINSSNGAAFSDAFDIDIIDQLSSGLQFCSFADGAPCQNPTSNNSITGVDSISTTPTLVTGSGAPADPYILNWNSVNASATDIDIPENTTTTVTYTVRVMDNVLANQQLVNNATIFWTGLDGVHGAYERDGTTDTPADRRYINGPVSSPVLTVPDVNALAKALENTSSILVGANDVRIGDVVDYELTIDLQEGTSQNVVIEDTLPQGHQFEGIVNVGINGAVDNDGAFSAATPLSFTAFNQTIANVVGDPAAGSSTVTFNLGDIVNTGNNITTDNELTIVYRARVLDQVQAPLNNPVSNINLTNSVDLDYGTATGVSSDNVNTVTVLIDQPNLSVNKALDPVVPDSVIEANEFVTFYIDIINSGESPAYDLVLQDILPAGLRNGAAAPAITNIEMPVTNNIAPRPTQTYTSATGELVWDFDTGVVNELTIPAGVTLRITYQVQADSNIASGLSVSNLAQVLRYYSFDNQQIPVPPNVTTGATADTQIVAPELDDREQYGPSNTDNVALTTAGPLVLNKGNNGNIEVSIGQPFTYLIKVPDVAVNSVLHDVRITDDLPTVPGTSLLFVSAASVDDDADVSPDEDDTYTPVNTGTPRNVVIEDVINGIEIPPNQTITVGLTVQLEDVIDNAAGGTFTNTADYTFNSIDNNSASQGSGMPDTTGIITIVEPFLAITKTGPSAPNTVLFNTPIPYRLVVENTGTGPSFDTTITDVLPQVADNPPLPATPLSGGTCDVAPNNIVVGVYKDDETTLVNALALNTDYVVSHTPRPTCELVITTLTPLAKIEEDEKLIITYDAFLDVDSQNTAELTNTASVTEYFSQDTPAGVKVGQIRQYKNDAGSALDESSYTVIVEAPELVITKIPDNLTTGGSGASADPGDTLHYTIQIQNNGPIATGVFSFSDEPDRLNPAPGYFDFSSIPDVLVNGVSAPFTAIAGVLNVTNLNLDALGGANDSLTIEFDIKLIDVINAGTVVVNQGQVDMTGFSLLPTDDPSINVVPADPTETLIDAVPVFMVSKRSADITGDTNVLRQGDTLRYTLEVKNIGLENSNNAYLRDVTPANTHYVPGSTQLNGITVPDLPNNASPLESEMLINAPENTTPGFMRADADPGVTSNVATITFDVIVDIDVIDGTVISNQGYVGGLGAGSGSFAEQASNDPDTTLVNDPTIDVVGNLPAIDAQKTVSLSNDVISNDIVDAGDELEYKIVVRNGGAIAATQVSLIDDVTISGNSSYIANSVSINGVGILDADLVSLSPLTIRFNSSDLGLPVQAANDGQITAGNEAIIRYRVTVTGVPTSLISNQGTIVTNELPDQLTDADGNSTNGTQPTNIYIGVNSEIELTKEVFIVGGGVAQSGGTLEYVLQVQNTGSVDASNILLTDVIPANVTYQLGSTKLDGSTAFIGSGVAEPGVNLLVNFQLAKGVLEAGEKFTVSYRVDTNNSLVSGDEIMNTATVTWTEMTAAVSDSASIEIGGAPGVGVMGGNVWHDIIRTPSGVFTSGTDLNLQNWTVQIYLNNPVRTLFSITTTDENGFYQFKGLPPGSTAGGEYELRIIPPGGSDTSASMGQTVLDALHGADSGVSGEMSITGITVNAGVNIANQNLPAIPTGVIYDAILRTPVAGATIRLLLDNGNPVPANCLPLNSNQTSQQTLSNGFYRFDIQAASCGETDFVIDIDGVPNGYFQTASQIIPPGRASNAQIDVTTCNDASDDMILGNGDCDIQFSADQPGASVLVRTDSTRLGVSGETQGTTYYLNMLVDTDGEVAFNNHIPLDPEAISVVAISKISPMLNVVRGQLVPYLITLRNSAIVPLFDLDVEDVFPAGFKYIAESASMQFGSAPYIKSEPIIDQQIRKLTWTNIGLLGVNEEIKIKFLLVVGSGVGEGEYVNRAQVRNNITNALVSGVATATVRVVPDPTFDCSDVIGKVFDDKNLNGYQDEGEDGLPGARVVSAKGLKVTADKNGRFHITCAIVPNQDRGSNFILKLDERSLPSGYRLTTENPRVQKATRGKMLKFNFGAAIHHVIRLDMADAVFEENGTGIRPQWRSRLDVLIEELQKKASVLRLSYLADTEDESLVDDRMQYVKDKIADRWQRLDCCYKLKIETEVFWRRGAPANREAFDE